MSLSHEQLAILSESISARVAQLPPNEISLLLSALFRELAEYKQDRAFDVTTAFAATGHPKLDRDQIFLHTYNPPLASLGEKQLHTFHASVLAYSIVEYLIEQEEKVPDPTPADYFDWAKDLLVAPPRPHDPFSQVRPLAQSILDKLKRIPSPPRLSSRSNLN